MTRLPAPHPPALERRTKTIITEIRRLASKSVRAEMGRVGIDVDLASGVSIYELRKVAARLGRDHELALSLWASGVHEARLLACFIDDPDEVTEKQCEEWVREFRSWDLCDQATTSLFDQTRHAWQLARRWSKSEREWTKRAGFALMAGLAVHDKEAKDKAYLQLFPSIAKGARDPRNFVKKAVSWALRNIGKRNRELNRAVIVCAEQLRDDASRQELDDRTRAQRWVATDVLRELTSAKVQARLEARERPAKAKTCA